MVPWQLTGTAGRIGSLTIGEALARKQVELDSEGRGWLDPAQPDPALSALWSHIEPLLRTDAPNWLILPYSERNQADWWQARAGHAAEVLFGRASAALALRQMGRLGVAGRLIAADAPMHQALPVQAVMAVDMTPAEQGLVFELTELDGRLDGKTDVGALIALGQDVTRRPEALFCPGNSGDDVERLLPFLGQLGEWAGPDVRWEFPEAPLGYLGVVGSLFTWAWVEAGYRLGDYQAPLVLLEMDKSPLVGLVVVRHEGDSGGRNLLT